MAERMGPGASSREACGTESVAVGREAFVRGVSKRIDHRMRMETVREGGVWPVREEPAAYGRFSASKTAPKPTPGPHSLL